MRRLLLCSLLAATLAASCKKKADDTPDYSTTLFQPDPSWERVAVVPWQGSYGIYERDFVFGDLQMTPSGALMLAYGQFPATSPGLPVYLAITDEGSSKLATVLSAGFQVQPYRSINPFFFLQPATSNAFACTVSSSFDFFRPDGLTASTATASLACRNQFYAGQDGPRYRPHLHSNGDVVFDNEEWSANLTSIYNTISNRWRHIRKSALPAPTNSWFSYQTADGVTGVCALHASQDSLFFSIGILNTANQNFELAFTQAIPEFSARGVAEHCKILSYNDEDRHLVVAVARFEDSKSMEASVYKLPEGALHFSNLYTVSLPAASSGGQSQYWGYQQDFEFGTSACTPDGLLYDLLKEDNKYEYSLITVDAAGIHKKAQFVSKGGGKIHRWPVFYKNGSFYLVAQSLYDAASADKNFRMEVLRVR